MNSLIKSLQAWINYFLTESNSAARGDISTASREFSVSNSERQNAQNLKAYYASLRRGEGAKATGSAAGSPAIGKLDPSDNRAAPLPLDPKSQIVDIDSPARGGMYRTGSARDLNNAATGINRVASPVEASLAQQFAASNNSASTQAGLTATERVELQRKEIETLTMCLKQALETEVATRKEVDAMRQALSERDSETKKQLDDLNTNFEAKKRSLNFIVNAKDMEIEKLRSEKQKLTDLRIKELEDTIALRDHEITELKSKLNDKEIEILERKESEMALQEKFESTVAGVTKENTKKLQELQEMQSRLKDRYFFALALSSPALSAATHPSLDLPALYDRCIREHIPFDQWPDWLTQFANENQRAEGEEENVENF